MAVAVHLVLKYRRWLPYLRKVSIYANILQGGAGNKYIGDGCLVCYWKSLEGDGGFMFFDAKC